MATVPEPGHNGPAQRHQVGDARWLGGFVANILDDHLVTLVCDHCGEETQARVGTLRLNHTVACLACGVSLEYNAATYAHDGERSQNERGDSPKPLD